MQIKEYARERNLKNSDNFIIDNDNGTYRTTGEDVKTFVTDNRSSSIVAFNTVATDDDCVNVQNETTGEHTKLPLKSLKDALIKSSAEDQKPSNAEPIDISTMPDNNNRSDTSEYNFLIEDPDGNVKRISMADMLSYIVSHTNPESIEPVPNGYHIDDGYLVKTTNIDLDEPFKARIATLNPRNFTKINSKDDIDILANDPPYLSDLVHNSSYNIRAIFEKFREEFPKYLIPRGTVSFNNLPSLSNASVSDMYNISDDFITTSDFIEGAGKKVGAGTNVYCVLTGDGNKKWDVMGGFSECNTGLQRLPFFGDMYKWYGTSISDGSCWIYSGHDVQYLFKNAKQVDFHLVFGTENNSMGLGGPKYTELQYIMRYDESINAESSINKCSLILCPPTYPYQVINEYLKSDSAFERSPTLLYSGGPGPSNGIRWMIKNLQTALGNAFSGGPNVTLISKYSYLIKHLT